MLREKAVVATTAFVLLNCSKNAPTDERGSKPSSSSCTLDEEQSREEPPTADGLLAPLEDATPLAMPLDGFGPATVEIPRGAREPRPVVVALHGHSIRPEHACEQWRHASWGHAFVLCPHGLPKTARANQPLTLGSESYTWKEIEAGLESLRQRFGDHARVDIPVFAGYSLGTKLGALIVEKHPNRFRRVAFGEGAFDELTLSRLRSYAEGGVQRLLLICSSKACELSYERVLRACSRTNLSCRLAPSGENPHHFEGNVVQASREAWPWLVHDAAGWETFSPSEDERPNRSAIPFPGQAGSGP